MKIMNLCNVINGPIIGINSIGDKVWLKLGQTGMR